MTNQEHAAIADTVFRIVWSGLRRRFRTRQDDARQQLILFILEKLSSLPPGVRPSVHLLVVDAMRRMTRWGMRDTRQPELVEDVMGGSDGDCWDATIAAPAGSDTGRDIREAIATLPERDRRLFQAVYVRHEAIRSYSRRHHLPIDSVQRRLGRLRYRLIHRLEN